MSGIYLTDQELAALYGIPPLAQRLYIFGIRRSMTYRTGLVGEETPISWHGLARELRTEPAPGIKAELPGKEQLRRAAQHLVKAGLVTMESQGLKLVFCCLLARRDSSTTNKADIGPTYQVAQNPPESQHTQAPAVAEFEPVEGELPDTEADTAKNEKPTHIKGSGYITPTTTAPGIEFALPINWAPSDTFAALCRRAQIDPDSQATADSLINFVAHYHAQPGRTLRQGQWEALAIKWLNRDRATATAHAAQAIQAQAVAGYAAGRPVADTPAQRRADLTAAVMNIDDTNW